MGRGLPDGRGETNCSMGEMKEIWVCPIGDDNIKVSYFISLTH